MNDALKNILRYLLAHNIICGKHIPEQMILKKYIAPLRPFEQREFFTEYKSLINQNYVFRQKKRTGKGYEEHISLNARFIEEISSWLSETSEVE
jgi:hypothetical protein